MHFILCLSPVWTHNTQTVFWVCSIGTQHQTHVRRVSVLHFLALHLSSRVQYVGHGHVHKEMALKGLNMCYYVTGTLLCPPLLHPVLLHRILWLSINLFDLARLVLCVVLRNSLCDSDLYWCFSNGIVTPTQTSLLCLKQNIKMFHQGGFVFYSTQRRRRDRQAWFLSCRSMKRKRGGSPPGHVVR